MPAHVIKGDTVMITSGALKGQTGEVLRVNPDKQQVIIKGLNLRTKNIRPTRDNPQGSVITKEAPLHISKVQPLGADGKPSRVRFKTKADGTKVRVAARGEKELSVVHASRKK
jgi:large subunit ribosomal protein L24